MGSNRLCDAGVIVCSSAVRTALSSPLVSSAKSASGAGTGLDVLVIARAWAARLCLAAHVLLMIMIAC